jgi:hypothetical protein
MGPPHGLQSRGWTRTTMKLGDEIEVNGSMAKNGSKRVNARNVVMVSTGQNLGRGLQRRRHAVVVFRSGQYLIRCGGYDMSSRTVVCSALVLALITVFAVPSY